MLNRIYLILFFITFLFFSCDENTDPSPTYVDGFNRTELLDNISNNIIIPAFDEFYNSLLILQENSNVFITSPNTINLETYQILG